MKLGDPLVWQSAKSPKKSEDKKLSLCFFGECGTGKSTNLNLISRIYAAKFKTDDFTTFKSAKSGKAVTTKVKVVQTGNMTLIDTPGTNDPDKKRTDHQI